MAKKETQESPSGGTRMLHGWVQDDVKDPNSELEHGGFTRFVHKFNNNSNMRSPTTSSTDCRPVEQRYKPNRGFAGKIKP